MTPEQKKDAHLEGKILKELEHPNIIHFREVLTDKDFLYIVMDYADGGDLSIKIKEQNGNFFPENKILDWFTQVCLAIKHIHDRKILHRDIKSQNIFLMKNGQIKLGDFGIAKCLNQTIDKAKTYVGTPYYLSPEIINSQPYDFKSDIWSLGVLLYEMCALKMPFDASNLAQLYIKIIKCNYPPLSGNYSDELKKLVKDMLNETSIKRPNINDILNNYSIIKSRIKKFLSKKEYEAEFSHTILHKFNLNDNNNNNIRISQGPTNINRPNLKVSGNEGSKKINYHFFPSTQFDNIDKDKDNKDKNKEIKRFEYLRKNLEGKAINHSNNNKYYNNKNRYNNNSNNFYYINNNINNNNSGRNKNINNSEYFSNNNHVLNNNFNNNINNQNSASKQKKIEYNKKNSGQKNIKIVNTPSGNIKSNRDKEKERKQNLEEIKRIGKQKKSQNDGGVVVWMKGMENFQQKEKNFFVEKNKINKVNNSNDNDILTDNDKKLCNDYLIGKMSENNSSGKKEINGKNLLLLKNINLNNMKIMNLNNSNEYMKEDEIKENNILYEDIMKQNTNNNINDIYYNDLNNNNNNSYSILKENLNYENNLEINGEEVGENIWNQINNEFGQEISKNISNIIKKYVKEDMITYDYSKITDDIIKDFKNKNISQNLIEKAINKIPDIFFLILCKRL